VLQNGFRRLCPLANVLRRLGLKVGGAACGV